MHTTKAMSSWGQILLCWDDDDDEDDDDDDDDDKQIESNRNFILKNSKFRSDVSLICKEYICGKSKLCQKIEFSFRRKSIFSPWP